MRLWYSGPAHLPAGNLIESGRTRYINTKLECQRGAGGQLLSPIDALEHAVSISNYSNNSKSPAVIRTPWCSHAPQCQLQDPDLNDFPSSLHFNLGSGENFFFMHACIRTSKGLQCDGGRRMCPCLCAPSAC